MSKSASIAHVLTLLHHTLSVAASVLASLDATVHMCTRGDKNRAVC